MSRAIGPLRTAGGYPNRILGFDTETHGHDPHAAAQRQILTLGHSGYQDFRDMDRPDMREFAASGSFWDRVELLAEPCQPPRYAINDPEMLYVVAHNAGFDIMVLAMDRELQARGWTLAATPVFPRPLYLEFERDGYRFVVLNLANLYGYVPLAEIGDTLGFPKGSPAGCGRCRRCRDGQNVTCHIYRPENGCVPGSPAWKELSAYCEQDTRIVVEAMRRWNQFCLENDTGPFRFTAPGQAMAAWRSGFAPDHESEPHRAVYAPDHPAVQALERASYHGGLTDVWRRGTYRHADLDDRHKVDGSGFVKLDVNSMHPSQMATQKYPRALLQFASRGNLHSLTAEQRVEKLRATIKAGYGVTARVVIDTDVVPAPDVRFLATAPVKVEGKLVYPIGQFESVLTTREAAECLAIGTVIDVLEFAVYDMADLFSGYVRKFARLKENATLDGDDLTRALAKAFLTNLYGKFGQLDNVELRISDQQRAQLARELEHAGTAVEVYAREDAPDLTVRSFMGHLSVSEGRSRESFTAFCAIAAHIVADSRYLIRRLRAIAGYDESYYCDTDSLIVTEVGYRNLLEAGLVDEAALGRLKVEGFAADVELLAPKDYRFGDIVRRKGISPRAVPAGYAVSRMHGSAWLDRSDKPGEGRFPIYRQPQFRTLNGALRHGDPNIAVVESVEKIATGIYTKGEINAESGWITPLRLSFDHDSTGRPERRGPARDPGRRESPGSRAADR